MKSFLRSDSAREGGADLSTKLDRWFRNIGGLRPRGRGGFKLSSRLTCGACCGDSAREGGADLSFAHSSGCVLFVVDSAREGGADLSDLPDVLKLLIWDSAREGGADLSLCCIFRPRRPVFTVD